jgi:hypothetical protein
MVLVVVTSVCPGVGNPRKNSMRIHPEFKRITGITKGSISEIDRLGHTMGKAQMLKQYQKRDRQHLYITREEPLSLTYGKKRNTKKCEQTRD